MEILYFLDQYLLLHIFSGLVAKILSIASIECFFNNSAKEGEVAYIEKASLTDFGCMYYNNRACVNGGVATLNEGVAKMVASSFVNNSAGSSSGVLFTPIHFYQNQITFENSTFDNIGAIKGGVIAMLANASYSVNERE